MVRRTCLCGLIFLAIALAPLVRASQQADARVSDDGAHLVVSLIRYAEQLERNAGPQSLPLAQVLTALAQACRSAGSLEDALAYQRRAVDIYRTVRGPEDVDTASALAWLSAIDAALARHEEALEIRLRVVEIFRVRRGATHDDTVAAMSRLADSYADLGRHGDALLLRREVLAIYQSTHNATEVVVGMATDKLANALGELGQFAEAISLHREALAILEAAGDRRGAATAMHELAGTYASLGKYETALPIQNDAVSIFRDLPNTPGQAVADAIAPQVRLAEIMIALGRFDAAAGILQASLADLEQAYGHANPVLSGPLRLLADNYVRLGRFDAARPLLDRALISGLRAKDRERLWRVQADLSRLSIASGDPGSAIFWGKQAVNSIQSLRGELVRLDRDLRESFLKGKEHVYADLARLLIDDGRLAEAEQVLAMLKERELTELLRGNDIDARRTQADYVGPERQAVDEHQRLAARGVQEASELAALERRRKHGETLSAADETRLQDLLKAAGEWRAEYQRFLVDLGKILARSGQAGGEKATAKETTNLQKKVGIDPAGAVGLHYVVTEERVAIIVATARGSFGRASAVTRRELDRQILAFRKAILDRQDTRPAAQALWQALIAPVYADLQAVEARTLVLSLTDTLRYLPFAALQDQTGRYLVQDYALSLWAAAADVDPRASPQGWNVAGMGMTQARPGFAALPAVRAELQGIVRTAGSPNGVLPGTIALDEQFSRGKLEAALFGPHNVLHVASHFDFRLGDEQRSVLLIGEGEPISLAQMAVMNFSEIEQLTLSACETAFGGGTNENGAEVEGLAAAVQNSGAKAVLASLWKVADASTARLMRTFYEQRASEPPPGRAQALRQAQLALIDGRPDSVPASGGTDTQRQASRPGATLAAPPVAVDPAKPYAHPYFWAPFILMGNWL